MPPVNNESLTRILGESMVELAEANLERVCQHLTADRRLVRLNLIAFCAFGLGWWAADKLNDQQIGVFTAGVARGAAAKAGLGVSDKALEFFRSRHNGFLTALANQQHNQMALTNYFQACCSVDRIEIDYADIYPDPATLEEMGKTVGGLTQAGQAMIEKVRAMRKPAVYPMNAFGAFALFGLLTDLMEHLKQSLARLGKTQMPR
jgi:hypothetical protein